MEFGDGVSLILRLGFRGEGLKESDYCLEKDCLFMIHMEMNHIYFYLMVIHSCPHSFLHLYDVVSNLNLV